MRRDEPAFVPDRDRIIELFVKRQPAYAREDVLRLLQISEDEIDVAVAEGSVAPEHNDAGAMVIPWEDVAHLALEHWTPRIIEAALGTAAEEVIPHLNQHRPIQITLPIYLIRYLHHRALQESRDGIPRNASDIIEALLHNDAGATEPQQLEVDIPGFLAALRYPYYIPTPTSMRRCRYCDITITEPARAVCTTCEQRHELGNRR